MAVSATIIRLESNAFKRKEFQSMNDIISVHRADLVDAVTEAVKPLKARIASLESELSDWQRRAGEVCDERAHQTEKLEGVVRLHGRRTL